jgi:hypothetical protein
MKTSTLIIMSVLFWMTFANASFGQEDLKPWEKYGLSQSEWKMVQDNKISVNKMQELLSAGISVGEYVKKPWKELGLSERDWVEKRRAGLTSYDIELEMKAKRRHLKGDVKNEPSSEFASWSSGKNQMIGFLVPGFQQLRLNQMTRGRIMAGIAIVSLAGCFVGSVVEGKFEPRPLAVIVPDMCWSFIDFKITIGKMNR